MSHCCLCGLLCSLDRVATENAEPRCESHTALFRLPNVEDCHRRNQWLAQTRSSGSSAIDRSTSAANSSIESQSAQVATVAALFKPTQRSLIWIDGADVTTTRSAVSLAEAIRGTVHIGQSSGAAATHRVLANQGWLGSSLAEVATHADLIITLGGGLRAEAPLLAQRFFAPAIARGSAESDAERRATLAQRFFAPALARGSAESDAERRATLAQRLFVPALASGRAEWCHIDAHVDAYSKQASGTSVDELSPSYTAVWPREKWYEALTHIMLALQSKPSPNEHLAARADAWVDTLVSKLQRAKNIVWLWDAEEFRDAMDELCISRLLGISRLLMQSARCSLLCLESQVGRVTAQETLLWLTGCSGTADFDGARWRQPQSLGHIALDEWQNAFDSILVVRSVPSVHPLPNLNANHFMVTGQSLLPDGVEASRVTRVSTVGIDCDGHLMRGDRATMMYCAASRTASSQGKPTPTGLPTAAELLDQVRHQLQSGAALDAN